MSPVPWWRSWCGTARWCSMGTCCSTSTRSPRNPGKKRMPELIAAPTRIEAAGTPPKRIDEFVGRVNTGTAQVSIAQMRSPSGWLEPGQTPEFDEYTVVLRGSLQVTSREGVLDVNAGQGVLVRAGEWV